MSPTVRNMRKTWKLELLVDGIDPNLLNWIKEENSFTCTEELTWNGSENSQPLHG